jgi:hypothetical protein
MAWRRCVVVGCTKSKPIQPWGTTTVHRWLCPLHRAEALHLSSIKKNRHQALKGMMSGGQKLTSGGR